MSTTIEEGVEGSQNVLLGVDNGSQPPLDPLFHSGASLEIQMGNGHINMDEEVANNVEGLVEEVAIPRIRRRVGRGRNRPRWASNGVREVMIFNDMGQAVEPARTVARFSRFLGLLSHESSLFPIQVKDWRSFYAGTNINRGWDRIKGTIDWTNPRTLALESKIRRVCEIKLNDRWKHYKAMMRKKWYGPFIHSEQRFTCNDPRVNMSQWGLLVKHQDDPKAQRRSAAAVLNRRELRFSHTSGTRSFAQIRYEYAQVNGHEPDRITFFTLTHTREDGEPIDAKSAEIIDEFKEKLQIYHERNEEVTDAIRHQVYAEVLGLEKRNRVRGYGIGVGWADVPGVVVEERPINREMQALRAAYEAQREAANVAHEEIERLRIEVSDREARLIEETASLAMQLRKEQVDAMKMHKNQMELEIAGMRRGMMLDLMSALKNTSSDASNVAEGNSVEVIKAWLQKFDHVSTENDATSLAPIAPSSIEEDYEIVDMDEEDGYRPVMPPGITDVY